MTTASFNAGTGTATLAGAFERWQFASLADTSKPRTAPAATAPGTGDKAAMERWRQEARAAGHAEGLAAGLAEGRQRADTEMARIHAMAEAMSYALNTLQDEVGLAVMDLALEVARDVLRNELAVNRETLLAAVREAVDLAGSGPHPQLLLNPEDSAMVKERIGDELIAAGWRIAEDDRIDPGGCRVTTINGSIDATLAARWRAVVSALGRNHAWER